MITTDKDKDKWTEVALSLGANLGDRQTTLARAIKLIASSGGCQLVSTSSFYATEPVGYTEQPEFINCAVVIRTTRSPAALLSRLRAIERALGRRGRGKWREREIDIDIVFYADKRVDTPELTIPHPEMQRRRFVLEPLAEIAPAMRHPVLGLTVREILDRIEASQTAPAVRWNIRAWILGATDPVAPIAPSRLMWILVALVLVLLLLPTLLLPLGPDQGLFYIAGERILRGDIPYRDFIDIKPPLIYYLYAGAIALFGHAPIAIRLLDFVLQGFCCWMLAAVVYRLTRNGPAAMLTPIFYLLMYLGIGFASLAQTESYIALLGGGIIWMIMVRRTPTAFFVAGILAGVLLLFKFTLGILLVPALLYEFERFGQTLRRRMLHIALMIGGTTVMVVLFVAFLVGTGAMEGFLELQEFAKGYTSTEWQSLALWTKRFCSLLPQHIAVDISLVLTLLCGAGMAVVLLPSSRPSSERLLLRHTIIVMVLLTATVALEAKYFAWHISRLFPYAAIIAAFGGMIVGRRWAFAVRAPSWRRPSDILIVGVLITSLVLFSPVAGYSWRTLALSVKNLKREIQGRVESGTFTQDIATDEAQNVAAYVRPRLGDGRMLVLSGMSGLIYQESGYVPDYRLLHSAFFIAPFSPKSWREHTRNYVLHKRPEFIVTQLNDTFASLNGVSINSTTALRALPGIDSVMTADYTLVHSSKMLRVFERRDHIAPKKREELP